MRRNTRKSQTESNSAPTPYSEATDGRAGEETAVAAAAPPDSVAVNGKPANGKRAPAAPEPDVSFWDQLANLGEEKWASGNYEVRIYRVWPIVERKQPDGVYIGLFKEPVDEPMLLERFGGGRYLLLFRHRGKLIRKLSTTVGGNEVAPKVDETEVLRDEPANERFFRVWGAKKATAAASAAGKADGTPAKGETAEILNTIFERGNKADPALIDLFKDASKQRDELARLLSEKQTAPAPAPQLDLLAILSRVKELQGDPFSALEKLKAFLPKEVERPKQEPTTNALEQLQQVMEIFSQARELFKPETPPAAAATASPDADLLEKIAVTLSGQVGPLVAGIPAIIAAFKGTPVAPPPMLGATPPAGMTSFNPYDPAAMRAYTQAQKASAGATPTPTPPPTGRAPNGPPGALPNPASPTPPPENELQALVQIYGGIVISHLNMGTTGWGFADYVVGLLGTATHAQICAQGEPALVGALLAVPEIAMFGEPRLRKFVHEFIHFEEYGDEEEEEGQQEPKNRKAATMRE